MTKKEMINEIDKFLSKQKAGEHCFKTKDTILGDGKTYILNLVGYANHNTKALLYLWSSQFYIGEKALCYWKRSIVKEVYDLVIKEGNNE